MIKNSGNIFGRGFTLIELLVVIAIIGVLSSVVLASLRNSSVKAQDAKTKSQLNAIIPIAQIYYDIVTGGSWTGICTNQTPNANIDAMVVSATKNRTTGNCGGSGQAGWKAWAQLSDGRYWCVDYTAATRTCDVAPSGQSGGLWVCQTANPYNCS